MVSNTHFALSMAAFYGLPPALLQPFVGKHKCTNGQLLDEYGDNLTLSNMAGDGWRKRHDVFKWGKAAFGRRRSADAANREAYEEYSRHYCSGDGGHAGGRSRT